MKVSIVALSKNAQIPQYQTVGAAGSDLHACLDEPMVLAPMERAVVPTGIAVSIPEGYEAQIRARSGMSLRHGITMVNGVGTIDADYRGEVGVLLINLGKEAFTIEPGMRIAQMVFAKYEKIDWQIVDELPQTKRNKKGFGSSGYK